MFKTDTEKAQERKFEEELYNIVAQELRENIKLDSLHMKALASAGSDKELAQSLYIQYRIQSLKDEILINQENQRIEEVRKREYQNIQQEKKANEEKQKLKEIAQRKSKKFWNSLFYIIFDIFIFFSLTGIIAGVFMGFSLFVKSGDNDMILISITYLVSFFITYLIRKNRNKKL